MKSLNIRQIENLEGGIICNPVTYTLLGICNPMCDVADLFNNTVGPLGLPVSMSCPLQ